jgi:uncharacterized membrane protein YedE/YeeE
MAERPQGGCEGGPTWREGVGGLWWHAPLLWFFSGYLRQAAKFRLQPSSAFNQAVTAAASAKLILFHLYSEPKVRSKRLLQMQCLCLSPARDALRPYNPLALAR